MPAPTPRPHAPRKPQRHSRSGVARRGGGSTGVEQALLPGTGQLSAPTLSGISHDATTIYFRVGTSPKATRISDSLPFLRHRCARIICDGHFSIVFQVFGVWAWTADRGPFGGSSALNWIFDHPMIGAECNCDLESRLCMCDCTRDERRRAFRKANVSFCFSF